MGQEILYCYKCQGKIVGADFVGGKAFQVGNHVSCASCAADLLQTLDHKEREQLLGKMFKATQDRQTHSSGVLPSMGAAASPAKLKQSTVRLQAAPPPEAPAKDGPSMVAIAVGAVMLIGGGLVLALTLRGSPEPPPRKEVRQPTAAPAPAPVPAPAPPAETHEAARASMRKAKEIAAKNPKDLEGQIGAWRETLDAVAGTPFAAEARRELDAVLARRQDAIPKEWTELDAKVQSHVVASEYQAAIDLLQSARARYSISEWTQPLDRRIGEIYQASAKTSPPPVVPAPSPRPVAVDRKPDPALDPKFEAALVKASARDYAGALEELKGADLEAVRSAQGVLVEALDLVVKWPRGQALAVDAPDRIEGIVLRGDASRLALKQPTGAVWIQVGEITPASLAELWRSRAAKKPETDDRAAALFCLLEGDIAAARKIVADKTDRIPEKFWQYGAKAAELRRGPKEAEARDLFLATEEGLVDYTKAGPSVETCRMLLRDFGSTSFVARNRAAISSRAAGGKDYLFCADLIKPAGAWKAAKGSKAESCWTCEKDAPGNFLDLAFTAFAGTEYRCWVYAGGCCQETFQFNAQGTEMTVKGQPVEPGGASWSPVKLSLVGLKKAHTMHTGPKAPTTWAWVSVPLPRYATAGVKVVRLMPDQQGFAIAYAAVTTQKDPPREADLREFERSVKDFLGAPPKPVAAPAPARPGKVLYAEDFSKGRGRFNERGEIVDAGPGIKAIAMGPKGAMLGYPVTIKPTTVVRFRLKALFDLDFFEAMCWVNAKGANAWYHIPNLKKDEWRTVEFKLADMQMNYSGPAVGCERVEGMIFYYVNRPEDSRILLTDFELRE